MNHAFALIIDVLASELTHWTHLLGEIQTYGTYEIQVYFYLVAPDTTEKTHDHVSHTTDFLFAAQT